MDKTVPVDIRFQGEMDIQGSAGIKLFISTLISCFFMKKTKSEV